MCIVSRSDSLPFATAYCVGGVDTIRKLETRRHRHDSIALRVDVFDVGGCLSLIHI